LGRCRKALSRQRLKPAWGLWFSGKKEREREREGKEGKEREKGGGETGLYWDVSWPLAGCVILNNNNLCLIYKIQKEGVEPNSL
jgi:hypothetical protein